MSNYDGNKSTGNLYVNQFKTQSKQPPYTGYLEVTKEQISDLIKDGKDGKDLKMKLALWVYDSKKVAGEKRLFLTTETGYEPPNQIRKRSQSDWDEPQSNKPDNFSDFADDDVPF